MITLYIETSALLTWLFNEPEAPRVRDRIDKSERCVSSVLTLVETERAFRRALHQELLTCADFRKILG
ncbi:type II toxin-antitoxin system VapC family toxin, partial [candidate division CSSED10-310 bacterium]